MKKPSNLAALFLTAMISSCSALAVQNQAITKPTIQSPTFSQEQVRQIEQIVYNYIVNKNPKALMEAAQNLQKQELIKEKDRVKTAAIKYAHDIFNSNLGGRITLGNPNGNIILAEFLSYECGHCREMGPIVENLIKQNPNLEVILIYWPFQGNDAIYAAKIAIAAKAQGKFMDVHNAFMASEESLDKNAVEKIIKKIGLNEAKLANDIKQMDSNIDNGLKLNFKLADDLKLAGTPIFIAANRTLTKFEAVPGAGTEADLKQAIDKVR